MKEKEHEIRILILGLDNAGKTTIVKKLCGQSTDTVEPTLGFQITTIQHMNYKINLWDIGGQRSIRAYWRNYYEQTDGIIWVIDSTDTSRLDICKDEMYQVLSQEKLIGATVLLFANKQDIIIKNNKNSNNTEIDTKQAATANTDSHHETSGDDDINNNNQSKKNKSKIGNGNIDEIAEALELNEDNIRFGQRHWKIQGCSGITGDGLMDGIDWLVDDISNRIFFLS